MPVQSAKAKMETYVLAEIAKLVPPYSHSACLQHNCLTAISKSLPYVSPFDEEPKNTLVWHTIIKSKKFYTYHRNYEKIKFTPEDYVQYVNGIKSAPAVVQDIVASWRKIKVVPDDHKYRRADLPNKLFSIFKIQAQYFWVTHFLYTRPTNRSVVKVAIPITEKNGKLTFEFSAPMLLKIVYAENFDVIKPDALTLLYSNKVQTHKRASGPFKLQKQYILMPTLPGITLHAYYQRVTKIISYPHLLALLLAVTKELQRVHAAQWLHYDLKPNNIIISQSPNGYTTAHIIDTDEMEKRPSAPPFFMESTKGTPGYRAPELVSSGFHSPSDKIDIYALGIIFVEILTVDLRYRKIASIKKAIQFKNDDYIAAVNTLLPDELPIALLNIPAAAPELMGLVKSMINFKPTERPKLETIADTLTLLLDKAPMHSPQPPLIAAPAPQYPPNHTVPLSSGKSSDCLVM